MWNYSNTCSLFENLCPIKPDSRVKLSQHLLNVLSITPQIHRYPFFLIRKTTWVTFLADFGNTMQSYNHQFSDPEIQLQKRIYIFYEENEAETG